MPPPLKLWFKEHASDFARVGLALLLLFQFAGFVSVLSVHIDPRSLLSARDADGSHIVGTADRTRWYKDNGESAYGAFYYRLARTFNQLAGRDFAGDSSPTENRERAQHLTLMVLSLLAVFAIAYGLASLVVASLNSRLAITAALTGVFLNDPIWSTFVFRAHPDMLLALTLLVAFIATARMLERPHDQLRFYLAALAWGVTGMVKLTFVIFLPVIPFLFMPPFTRANMKRAWHFYLWMLPSYILLGFPQSLNLPRSLKFLHAQSQYNVPPTWESVGNWFENLRLQGTWPALIVSALALTSAFAPSLGRKRLAPLVLFAFAVVFKQNNEIEARYYLIPLLTLGLAWIALSIRIPRPAILKSYLAAIPYMILLAVMMTIGLVPRRMEAELKQTLTCRQDALRVYEAIHTEIALGRIFVLDPYVPFDRERAGPNAFGGWSNDWSTIARHQATGLVINVGIGRSFYPGPPPHSVQVDSPNWPEMTKFYASLLDRQVAKDPAGGVWRKQFETGCGLAFFQKD